MNQSTCSVAADEKKFGKDPCPGVFKQLAVQISCGVKQCDIVKERWSDKTSVATVGCNRGLKISHVNDAWFGELNGTCTHFATSGCHSDPVAVREVVEARCVGKTSCTVPVNAAYFGKDPCKNVTKSLAISVNCSDDHDAS
eukprot:SAG11_NODE_4806_length_1760_cov_1.713426_1_plen_141_part_01